MQQDVGPAAAPRCQGPQGFDVRDGPGVTALRDRPDSRETLASITVPTLILVGSEDVLTPLTEAQAMLERLPAQADGRLEVITDAGHATCVERPAAVTFALHEFLATLPVDRE